MSEFETVLQGCLLDLEQGVSNVEECLQRYPQYAEQLEPILLTSAYLVQGRESRLSPAFKARVRTRLLQEMHARPRKPARLSFGFMRLAASLAVVMLALFVAGTAYAQRALPGEAFYRLKIASEDAWRAISPDPVGTDLAIAERRAKELIAIRNDPALYTAVLKAYLEVTDTLMSGMNAETEALILSTLDTQMEELNQSGIILPQPDQDVLPPLDEPTATPAFVPSSTPLSILETPLANPTELPQIVPTVEVLPEILPTVQRPPKINPTIEIPPPIP